VAEAALALSDGTVLRGLSVGAEAVAAGEVVFNTAMTGYQEILTDPSYAGQIVLLTYPLIGNYGISRADVESRRIQVAGLIVKEAATAPSHNRSVATLGEYLRSQGVPAIAGIDTRALTRRIRSQGVMMGALAHGEADAARAALAASASYDGQNFVRTVTAQERYAGAPEGALHVAVLDYGVKFNIVRSLRARGCRCTVVPADTPAADVLALDPDAILLSPGPGDPQELDGIVDQVRRLLGRRPIMGICLGHQLAARALGAKTFKLKFGHRGGNHPVKDLDSGLVTITAQNHGYAVDPDSLTGGAAVSQINLNDGTVEGIRHPDLDLLSIQYHAEASPGPLDNQPAFDRFVARAAAYRASR
jgi:carbamoyl-phosphate synthase small subunit